MNLRQPKAAPDLKMGDRIKNAFRHFDNETNKEEMEYFAGKVITLRNGKNLRQGASFYRKNCAA